jgi:hypothetical protein
MHVHRLPAAQELAEGVGPMAIIRLSPIGPHSE